MKKLLFLVATAVAGVSVLADNWVYDPNGEIDYLGYKGGVVSDGVWKFKATVSGSNIKFGAVATNVYPEVVTPIDFSKPVEKAGDPSTTYTITELNDGFGFYRNGRLIPEWGYTSAGWDNIGWRPCCYRVGEITFPQDGLTTIGARFFTHCTNAVGTVVFPDSLTTLGADAFLSCKKMSIAAADLPSGLTSIAGGVFSSGIAITGDVVLPCIKTLGSSAFKGTAITSVTLGPDLTSIAGGYNAGAFSDCAQLTNLVFDASSSVQLDGGWILANSPKIPKTLDLSVVSKVTLQSNNASYPMFCNCAATKYIFSSKLTVLYSYSFHNCTEVGEVHFSGMPPTFTGDKVFLGANQKGLMTYVHLDKNDPDYATQKAAWDALTAGGELLEEGSTWSEAMAGDIYEKRPLLLYVPEVVRERGHWVYDDSTDVPVVSNGVWTFKAKLAGRSLIVQDVIGYPAEPTEIDFSKSATNLKGTPLTIVEVSPKFGNSNGAGAAAGFVSRVVFPTNKLETIGEYAFRGCDNMTDFVLSPSNLLTTIETAAFYGCSGATNTLVFPTTLKTIKSSAFASDSGLSFDFSLCQQLTTVEGGAFNASGLSGDIVLTNLTSIGGRAFANTAITSAKFGPNLASTDGNGTAGPFANCLSLTNVIFDANASTEFKNGGMFYGCTSLKEVDLAGVVKIGLMTDADYYSHFKASAVKKAFFSEKLAFLGAYTFSAAAYLSEVHFFGMPPATLCTPVLGGVSSAQAVTTYVHLDKKATTYDYAEAKAAWDKLTAGGELLEEGSTWSEAMAGANYKLRELVLYTEPEIGELGHWVYDERVSPAVVSNGVWAFNATKSGRTVSLAEVVSYPTSPTELDFTKPLTDHNGGKLTYFAISPHFGVSADANGFVGGPAAEYVTRLLLPTNGLFTIGDYAFCGCTNLTEVIPCLPDSVTTLGYAAFRGVKFAPGNTDIRLYGVSKLEKHVFVNTTATSVYFGPALKEIFSQWHEGAFYNVKSLTNAVFDAGITNCVLGGSTFGPFESCSGLVGHLNLAGFKALRLPMATEAPVSSVTIGAGCTEISSDSVAGLTALTNVIFLGDAPAALAQQTTFLKSRGSNTVVRTTISKKFKASWIPLTNEGRVQHKGTHWAGAYIGGEDYINARPISTVEPDGLMMIVK